MIDVFWLMFFFISLISTDSDPNWMHRIFLIWSIFSKISVLLNVFDSSQMISFLLKQDLLLFSQGMKSSIGMSSPKVNKVHSRSYYLWRKFGIKCFVGMIWCLVCCAALFQIVIIIFRVSWLFQFSVTSKEHQIRS